MANRTAEQQEIVKLKALAKGGKITPRQQTRLDFLRKQAQASAPAPTPSKPAPKSAVNTIKDPATKQAVKEDLAVAGQVAKENLKLGNVNQEGPFGSRTFETDANGVTTQRDVLDPGQQRIIDQDTELSQAGRDIAQQQIGTFSQPFAPELAARTSSGDALADRRRIEEEVFSSLTRDYDQQYAREEERLRQQLYEQGNVPGTPNYEREMDALNKRFDRAKLEARQQAVATGGEEWTRGFNINEALIGNQLNQAGMIRNQQLGELGTFAGFGPGARLPNFQGFQGTSMDVASPSSINAAFTQLDQNQQAINQRRPTGGGAAPSPFNNTLPPGFA